MREAIKFDQNVTVSVRVITYNHEKYLNKCLDSIINQKTKFRFEIVIGDDCSSDGTRAILEEYLSKYPELIRVIFREKNVGSNLNIHLTNLECRGKYIAWCDGDDYWLGTEKLQAQIDFLETHPDYVICFHNAWKINDRRPDIKIEFNPRLPVFKEFTPEDNFKTWLISNSSVVYRNGIITEKCPPFIWNGTHGDLMSFMFLSDYGKIGFLNKHLSVYRLHDASITRIAYSGIIHNEIHIRQCEEYNVFSNFRYDLFIRRNVSKYHLSSAYIYAKSNNRKESIRSIKNATAASKYSVFCSPIQLLKLFVFLLLGLSHITKKQIEYVKD